MTKVWKEDKSVNWAATGKYLSAVTNQPFMLQEIIQVARMLEDGLSWEQIQTQILEENALQIRSLATRKNVINGLRGRLLDAPPEILALLTSSTLDAARLTNFYLCLRRFRLLRELMAELIWDRASRQVTELTAFETDQFFSRKREQQPELARWSEETFAKVRSNTLNLAVEAGLLQGRGPWHLQRQILPPVLRLTLESLGDQAYLKLLLEV